MSSDTITINREASDKTKGFRLQKLRAAILALDEIESKTSELFYIAIEVDEDVSRLRMSDAGEDEQYSEENKDFPTSNFTLSSEPVKNTLVSFFDLYLKKWKESQNICFGFYTTAEIGKEYNAGVIKSLNIKLPDQGILRLLAEGEAEDSTLKIVKQVLEYEYSEQYSKIESDGYLNELKEMSLDNFKKFINKISWFFGQDDIEKLHSTLLDKVRSSIFFNYKLDGKENYILSELLESIESKQFKPNYSEKWITKTDIELIFIKAETIEADKRADSAYEIWKMMESPEDSRILKDKVTSVCNDFKEKELERLNRRALVAAIEEGNQGKEYLSLKYRIFESCEETLPDLLSDSVEFTESEIKNIIANISEAASAAIEELGQDFYYPVKNQHSIKSIILDLFNSCYLSFDNHV